MTSPQPPVKYKDPQAFLDYSIDWSAWLPSGDTIVTSTWMADGGITISMETNTSTTSTVWIAGGTTNVLHRATNQITTAAGRINNQSISIAVASR